jgi:hypothetical protein
VYTIAHDNDRDTNPPPPGELYSSPVEPPPSDASPHVDTPSGDSPTSLSLLSDNTGEFTIIGRTIEGHRTTSPRHATVSTVAPGAVPTHNSFDPLASDDVTSINSNGMPAITFVDATIRRIVDMFQKTNDTLAATTDEFNVMEARLERSLTRIMDTKLTSETVTLQQSFSNTISTFLDNLQRNADSAALARDKDIKRMDYLITQMSDHIQKDISSFTSAIATISSNTTKLAQETSTLSVRVVEHQHHLDNLLGFEEA